MDQLHNFPSRLLDYGTPTTSILNEVKNSWQNDQLGSLQDVFREKVRSEIAKDDCKKSMNALLRIGDLRKKGTFKGLTRRMSFEEMNACINLELANLSPKFDAKQPDISMTLEEMQEWLDKEFVVPQEHEIPRGNEKSTLKKIVNQSDKKEELLNEKVPNATLEPELENGKTSGLSETLRNSKMNVNPYADERSLFSLQKYVESWKKPALTSDEGCPPDHGSAVLSALFLADCPPVPPPAPRNVPADDHAQWQRKGQETTRHRLPRALQRTSPATPGCYCDGGGGDGDGVHATSEPPDDSLDPAHVWLQKKRRANTHRRCEACIAKEFASDTEEGYPRIHPPRPGLNRELFKNDAMPPELSADMTFLGPYYARMLSKYVRAKNSRELILMEDAENTTSNTLPHVPASASQKTLRVKSSVCCLNERSRSSLGQGEMVNGQKTSSVKRSNKKFPPINCEIPMHNSLLSNFPIGLDKDVPYNSRATSKTVMSISNTLNPNLSVNAKRNVPCNSRCSSKTIMSAPKLLQTSQVIPQACPQPPQVSKQPSENVTENVTGNVTEKVGAEAEEISEDPRTISEPPCALKANSCVLQSILLPGAPKSVPLPQPSLERPVVQHGGVSGKDSGSDRGGGDISDGGTEDGGGGNKVNPQISATELVRQWLTDSPQRPNDDYARRNVTRRKKDAATFSKAQKFAELERIYGRRMGSAQTMRPVSRPHTHPATEQRCRPEWQMY